MRREKVWLEGKGGCVDFLVLIISSSWYFKALKKGGAASCL